MGKYGNKFDFGGTGDIIGGVGRSPHINEVAAHFQACSTCTSSAFGSLIFLGDFSLHLQ